MDWQSFFSSSTMDTEIISPHLSHRVVKRKYKTDRRALSGTGLENELSFQFGETLAHIAQAIAKARRGVRRIQFIGFWIKACAVIGNNNFKITAIAGNSDFCACGSSVF